MWYPIPEPTGRWPWHDEVQYVPRVWHRRLTEWWRSSRNLPKNLQQDGGAFRSKPATGLRNFHTDAQAGVESGMSRREHHPSFVAVSCPPIQTPPNHPTPPTVLCERLSHPLQIGFLAIISGRQIKTKLHSPQQDHGCKIPYRS